MDASKVAHPSVWKRASLAVVSAYRTVMFHAVLAAFGLTFLGWSLPATALYWLLPARVARLFGQAAISWGFRNLLRLMRITGLATFDLTALDSLRGESRLVIASNHPSLIDVVLVISRLPRVVCITKASLLDNPALGAGARLAGYIRNDAAELPLVRRAAAAVQAGSQLLIFPEGTRTAGEGAVGQIKGGFALIARQARAPIQTVLLESDTDYLGKGWKLIRQPEFPLRYRARLGKRFDAGTNAAACAAAVEAYFRAELSGA